MDILPGIPETQITITILHFLHDVQHNNTNRWREKFYLCTHGVFPTHGRTRQTIFKYLSCFLHLHLHLTFHIISRIMSAPTVRLEVYDILSQISSSSLFSTFTSYSNKNSSIPHRDKSIAHHKCIHSKMPGTVVLKTFHEIQK